MESWSCVREEKRLECDVIDSASDPLFISSHPSFGCKENSNNLEHKFQDIYRKTVPHNPVCQILDGKFCNFPIVASNSKKFPLSDLKLGTHLREDYGSKLSRGIVQLTEYEAPQKRARVSKLNLQIAFCQVHGCNKDLSSSKDYHKKHKVCEPHTKAEKVIVNGIIQRFCQQCSRFHLIAEFDDAKRSCRRRLAGHNERRRKPQTGRPSGTSQRYLQLNNGFAGNMYNPWTTSTGTSLIFENYGLLHSKKLYETSNLFKDNLSFTTSTTPPAINGHLDLKPSSTSYDSRARIGAYPFDICGFYARPWSSLPHDSSASKVFHAESTVHDLPKFSNSGCARSLLSSSQPHDSSYNFSGPSHLNWKASTVAEQCLAVSPILDLEINGNNFQTKQGIPCQPEFQNIKDHFSL